MPYPADYGGAIDTFYRIRALHALGIRIHLHCFDYGRGHRGELEKYCESVSYYERFLGHKGISNTIPYIVSSRKNERLLQRLLQDDLPILMEGIHCTYLLTDKRFSNRKCLIRLHNVEYMYYRQLCSVSSSLLKKLYFWVESRLLKAYEKKIGNRATCLAITTADLQVYQTELGCRQIGYLPAFVPFAEIEATEGIGSYCLYHGDLSIEANEQAAEWLLKKVFAALQTPLVIAGKDPSDKLAGAVARSPNARLIANPTEPQLQELIGKAQMQVLPAFTATGIKLKLLNALFNGRHCVVNDAMVAGTGLEPLCHTATTARAFRELIAQLYHQPFTGEELRMRHSLLQTFSNNANAQRLVQLIWEK